MATDFGFHGESRFVQYVVVAVETVQCTAGVNKRAQVEHYF